MVDGRQVRREVLEFGEIGGERILDVATGNGGTAIILASDLDCRVTTVDLSRESIDNAMVAAEEKEALDMIDFIQADGCAMPFKDGEFEVVLCYNGLHHIPKYLRDTVVEEMFRVAGGRVVIADLNPEGVFYFDNYYRLESKHSELAVDLERFEGFLKGHCRSLVRKELSIVDVFVCRL